MSPLELVDDRFEQLARELRDSRPAASPALHERVRAMRPPPPPRLEFKARVLMPAAAVAAIALSLSAAGIVGLVRSGSNERAASGRQTGAVEQEAVRSAERADGAEIAGANALKAPLPSALSATSGAAGRLQKYNATLTLRVANQDDLAQRTRQATRLTRALGGYVASSVFNVPGKRGVSVLALRVPIDRVQQALDAFADYGTLISQRITTKDRQQIVDSMATRIAGIREEAGRIRAELEGSLSTARRAGLERKLAVDEGLILALTKSRRNLIRFSQVGRILLTLVTPKADGVAPANRFDKTLDDAASVLARELEVLLYALVAAGPLLVIGGLALVAARTQRRRSDQRLLERT